MGKLTDSTISMVHVRWKDPHSDQGWIDVDDMYPSGYAESCGFLVKDTEKDIFLALNLDFTNDNVNCYIAIPKVLIKSMHMLTLMEGANALPGEES